MTKGVEKVVVYQRELDPNIILSKKEVLEKLGTGEANLARLQHTFGFPKARKISVGKKAPKYGWMLGEVDEAIRALPERELTASELKMCKGGESIILNIKAPGTLPPPPPQQQLPVAKQVIPQPAPPPPPRPVQAALPVPPPPPPQVLKHNVGLEESSGLVLKTKDQYVIEGLMSDLLKMNRRIIQLEGKKG